MGWKYEKPFGTFELELEKGEADVNILGKINNGEQFNCKCFFQSKKAVTFWVTEKIKMGGKIVKVDGISLPNFDAVFSTYTIMKKEIEEEKKRRREEEIAAIKSGEKKIQVSYRDGEYLDGYSIWGEAAKLLEELGICKYVSGWGNLVDSQMVAELGEEFTYEQAVEYTRPAREKEAAKAAAKEAARQAKFDEARETGKPVELARYSDSCNDPREECSIDIVNVYAMPDGTTKTERHHTW